MSVLDIVMILVFVVPIIGLCIGFVFCVSFMQIQEEADVAQRRVQDQDLEDQQVVRRYRAYAAQVSNRRYVRPAGAMVRAAR